MTDTHTPDSLTMFLVDLVSELLSSGLLSDCPAEFLLLVLMQFLDHKHVYLQDMYLQFACIHVLILILHWDLLDIIPFLLWTDFFITSKWF